MGNLGADRGRGVASKWDLTDAAMVWRCSGVKGGAPGTQEAALDYGGAPRPVQREGEAMRKAAHDGHIRQRTEECGSDLPTIEVQGA
jgi:hypothetical protein